MFVDGLEGILQVQRRVRVARRVFAIRYMATLAAAQLQELVRRVFIQVV